MLNGSGLYAILFEQMTGKVIAENLSHFRYSKIRTPTSQSRATNLRYEFDKLLELLRDMNSSGTHIAAEEVCNRLTELKRCKFDRAAVERHHYAVQMPSLGGWRYQAA